MKKLDIEVSKQNDVNVLKYTLKASDVYDKKAADKAAGIQSIVPFQYSDEDGKRTITSYVRDLVSVEQFSKKPLNKKQVLCIMQGVAAAYQIGTQGIPVGYIVKDAAYIFVSEQTLAVKCVLVAIEDEKICMGDIPCLFRDILSKMIFDENDRDNYVAKLFSMINALDFEMSKFKNYLDSELTALGVPLNRDSGPSNVMPNQGEQAPNSLKVNKLAVMNSRQGMAPQGMPGQPNPMGQPVPGQMAPGMAPGMAPQGMPGQPRPMGQPVPGQMAPGMAPQGMPGQPRPMGQPVPGQMAPGMAPQGMPGQPRPMGQPVPGQMAPGMAPQGMPGQPRPMGQPVPGQMAPGMAPQGMPGMPSPMGQGMPEKESQNMPAGDKVEEIKEETAPEAAEEIKEEAAPEAVEEVKEEAAPEAVEEVKEEAAPEVAEEVKEEATPAVAEEKQVEVAPKPPVIPAMPQMPQPQAPVAPGMPQMPKPQAPVAPGMPQMPKPQAPVAPGMPQMPQPQAPAAPGMPQMPKPQAPVAPGMPQMPKPQAPVAPGMPQMPQPQAPVAPGMPQMPKPQAPGMPQMPKPQAPVAPGMPQMPKPQAPVAPGMPQMPQSQAPAAPGMPQMPQPQAPATSQPMSQNGMIGNLGNGEFTPGSLIGQVGQMGTRPVPHIIRKKTGEIINITKPEFTIGKSKTKADYAIEDNSAISRVHCIIVQRDGVNYIKDNNSTNHTYLNGVELAPGKEQLLKNKTLIQMGDEEFTFLLRKGD